jgi:hypothetical protein
MDLAILHGKPFGIPLFIDGLDFIRCGCQSLLTEPIAIELQLWLAKLTLGFV